MTSRIPDFFEDRTESWRFDDVLTFIDTHFNVSKCFAFRVGNRFNTPNENQRAGAVFAYAQQMDYTFNQVRALFSEHDHCAISMPETREGRNILEFNRLFVELLQKGHDADIKINDFPELFDIPRDVLVVKEKSHRIFMKKLFPNEEVITTRYFNVHQDWEIPISGFFIIVPLREVISIDELSDEETVEFIKLVRKVRKGMRDVLKIEEVYFFQNEDTEHGFHLWIFPRHKWMKKFGKKIQSVRPIMNYARENMTSEKDLEEVREAVQMMKLHLLQQG